ncbi:MAG: hypothetical protein V1811_03485, partial [Candidatus Micrarchaeota archaeon]
MIEEIIRHNIRTLSGEKQKLRRRKVPPVDQLFAITCHTNAFKKALTFPAPGREAWVKVLVERAHGDPKLDRTLKEKLKSTEDGKGGIIDV